MGKQNTLPQKFPKPKKACWWKVESMCWKTLYMWKIRKICSESCWTLKLIKLLIKGGTHSFLNVIFLFLEWDFPSCWHVNLHYLSFHSYIFHPCIHMQNTVFSLYTKINQVMIFLRSFAPQAQIMSGIILLLS